ncbi:AEC family transporter [Pseudoalteromonas sp. MEBiC 03607]|uniref:AEC family transporter n=1 Tax=Pseudoalteromonas sp. MEBiC 03607 TaxID=2563601 RepID=UPI001093ACD8|nr:AEC family transporter [Pseudoalteromonas sp. MEBiC 03607]TGV19965.1 AEC family transporter [Pseudoalteromonas sp. MEBiC 03607]
MHIFSIIFPLIFIVLSGYISSRSKFLSKEHIAGLSKFTFYISVPAFLFLNMAQADLKNSVSVAGFLSFYIPVLAIYALGYVIDRYFIATQSAPSRHAVFALGSSYSNTVLVGLPIIIAALGQQMVGIVFMIITFHSALLFTLTFLLSAKSQQTFSWRAFAKNMLLNPVVLSISSGLAVNLFGFTLFDDLANGLSLLAKLAIACALFVLGANLVFYKVADNWQASVIATIIKLAVLPCAVYFFASHVFNLEQSLLKVLVLLSASPLGVNAYLIANQIKQHQATLASSVVLSTVLSVVSFSVWLTILL